MEGSLTCRDRASTYYTDALFLFAELYAFALCYFSVYSWYARPSSNWPKLLIWLHILTKYLDARGPAIRSWCERTGSVYPIQNPIPYRPHIGHASECALISYPSYSGKANVHSLLRTVVLFMYTRINLTYDVPKLLRHRGGFHNTVPAAPCHDSASSTPDRILTIGRCLIGMRL